MHSFRWIQAEVEHSMSGDCTIADPGCFLSIDNIFVPFEDSLYRRATFWIIHTRLRREYPVRPMIRFSNGPAPDEIALRIFDIVSNQLL